MVINMSYFEFPHTRTYDSDLGWLIAKVKEVNTSFDTFTSDLEQLSSDLTSLTARVTTLEGEITGFIVEIDQRFAILNQEIDQRFATLTNEIVAQLAAYNETLAEFRSELIDIRSDSVAYSDLIGEAARAYTDLKIEELMQSIPDLTTVNVFNPCRGYITSIQTAIDDLYDRARYEALTAYEFDSANLTCTEFEALELTCTEFDERGKVYIWKNPAHYMYSPISGLYMTVQDAIIDIMDYFHGENILTATEYDTLELTASEYDAKNLTASEYDLRGKAILAA